AIATRYSLLAAAHGDSAASAGAARNALVLRYRKAIRRYLGGLLKDDAAADEGAQDVLVQLLEGAFAGASPAPRPFPDYLRTAVRNAALQYLRQRERRAGVDPEQISEADLAGGAPDDGWLAEWQRTLLETAQSALVEYQEAHPGNIYATVLDLVRKHPD